MARSYGLLAALLVGARHARDTLIRGQARSYGLLAALLVGARHARDISNYGHDPPLRH